MAQPFWTDLVRRLTPYVPGEQRHGDNIVKLNTNENPYPPSEKVLSSIAEVNGDSLRRYPDPESTELRQVLADYHQLSIDNVFVGNGSDEILALAFMAFFTGKAALQFPLHSYSFYPVYCDLLNIETRVLPMLSDFAIDIWHNHWKVLSGYWIAFPTQWYLSMKLMLILEGRVRSNW